MILHDFPAQSLCAILAVACFVAAALGWDKGKGLLFGLIFLTLMFVV